jgi:hypothetical protein
MKEIRLEDSALGQTTAEWYTAAPTQHSAPPVPTTLPTDPISAGVLAALADWPVVHETLAAIRSRKAVELAAANGGTSTNITTIDTQRATAITRSAEG